MPPLRTPLPHTIGSRQGLDLPTLLEALDCQAFSGVLELHFEGGKITLLRKVEEFRFSEARAAQPAAGISRKVGSTSSDGHTATDTYTKRIGETRLPFYAEHPQHGGQ